MTIRVLVADDQELVRSGLAALLNLEPDISVVAEASGGNQVLALVQEHDVDVCLLDVQMPGQDGIATASQLSEQVPGVKIIMVTTFARPGYVRAALEAGASGFVVKDTPARELADAVRRVHQGLRVVDPQLAIESLSAGDNPLTSREAEVLRLALRGLSAAQISRELYLSAGTVRNHLSNAIGKTGASNRMQAAQLAEQRGWL